MAGLTVQDLAFLIDLDNTLIDHDELKARIGSWVEANAPGIGVARFWEIYETVRDETGIVDFPEVASRYAFEAGSQDLHRRLTGLLWGFPFTEIVFPGSRALLSHLRMLGTPIVLCDGHEPFQRHKLHITGLAHDVAHNILVYPHKEEHAGEIQSLFPARHYVMIDDKPRIHMAMRAVFGERITTVLVRQGGYARTVPAGAVPEVDVEVGAIAELLSFSASDFLRPRRLSARGSSTTQRGV